MGARRSTKKSLERGIAAIVAGSEHRPDIQIEKSRGGRRGYRAFGVDESGDLIDYFVHRKITAESICDLYRQELPPEERLRRVQGLIRWDAESSPDTPVTTVITPGISIPGRQTVPGVQRSPGSTGRAKAPVTTTITPGISIPGLRRPSGSTVTPGTALAVVHRAVKAVPASGRFGPDKVFISALYDQVAPRLDWSLDEFKRWLVHANRDQLVDLARADAQGDMDPDLVERSEIRNLGASFHFVIDHAAHKDRYGWG